MLSRTDIGCKVKDRSQGADLSLARAMPQSATIRSPPFPPANACHVTASHTRSSIPFQHHEGQQGPMYPLVLPLKAETRLTPFLRLSLL